MLDQQKIQSLIEKHGHVFESCSQEQGSFGCIIFTHLKENEDFQFAIKVFDVSDDSKSKISEAKVKECQKEATAMKCFFHKNVVKYYSDYQLELFYFIQMKRCQSSLNVWAQNNQNEIPNSLFYSIALQILDGLEFIHDKDWILRDLKPQNVLVNEKDNKLIIKLCDFGAARCYPKLIKPKSTEYCGSLLYTPPEVLISLFQQKENIMQSKQGDIWAYGICLSIIGKSELNIYDYNKPNWVLPNSPLLTPQAQKFVKFILILNLAKRPGLKEIRQQLNTLFAEEFNQLQIKKKLKTNSILPVDGQNGLIQPAVGPEKAIQDQNDFINYLKIRFLIPFLNY